MSDPKKILADLNRKKETITLPKAAWFVVIALLCVAVVTLLRSC